MQHHFLLFNLTVDTVLSISIAFLLIGLFILNDKIIDKRKEIISKKFIFFIYFLYFGLLILGIYAIALIWEFNFNSINYDVLKENITDNVTNIVASIFIFVIGFFIIKISKLSILKLIKRNDIKQKRKLTIAKVSLSLIRYTVWIFGLIVFMSIWGVNVVPVVAGLGILGLVIGLGAQKFINDMISGFFIMIEHHYDIGDIIEVKGFKGEVTDIGLKTTKIRNWLGDVKILNNGDVTDITNYSLNHSMAVIEISIAYKENIDNVLEIINKKLPDFKERHDVIISDPTVLGVTSLGASSVNITVIVKTKSEKHYAVSRDLRKFLKTTLDENNIEIPFPQIVIHENKK